MEELERQDHEEEIDVQPNEAKVLITLVRGEDGIDGFILTREGFDFDPGDTEGFPQSDVLRLASELLLRASGYEDRDVQQFLDSAPRGPIRLEEREVEE
ncbi:hypothetical protein Tter_1378 [Thermobaculum terrenum ATCC BAA-798]|uniref:Uncharacterized protein n=1 Tax=Thermobaculum terrenum (strain ATCC BAA-798 / CCMEE 7001 / YNP1) TaxID=525904 RepID=D1CBX0_THET1|nr:hypothetical protein [Thermobaculum terrenum]ACZ42285.1 hypothetical protein Tter_1378 [Thermobaculum terrenum ATCC BAA-798]